MAEDMKMTFGDSEFCTFYEFPSKAFPGFRFIQDNLISFYPRFRRTVENLPLCLKWKDLLEDLSKHVEPLEQSLPEVILFGEKHSMIQVEQIVASINMLGKKEFKRDTFSRKDLLSHLSADRPQVIIYRCSSDQVQQEINHLEKELPKTGIDNMFLLIDVGGQSEHEGRVFLEEIINSLVDSAKKLWKDRLILNTSAQDISERITSHLEMCILKICKRIDDCIGEILSVQRKGESISILESDLVSAVNKFLQNKKVVQDFMNLAYQKEGSYQFIKKHVIWLIQGEVSTIFHAQFKMAAGDVHAMLDEVKFEEECKTKISPATWLSILSHLSETYMESIQSEESMETDSQTGKHYQKKRRSRDQQQSCQSVKRAKMLMKDIKPVLKEVKRFLWSVQEELKTLSHLQFELKEVLESTINEAKEIKKEVPDTTESIESWKNKLIQMDEVQGCGDYFGTLLIFISNQNSIAKEKEVKQKIVKVLSGCPYDYDIKFSTRPKTFANPKQGGASNQMQQLNFKAGDKLRWQNEKGQLIHGTLGMFIRGINGLSVYFVTNGHVVNGKGKCYISVNDDYYEELGTDKWDHYNGFIDIAALKVKSSMLAHCMLHYENYYGEQCSNVTFKNSEDSRSLVGKKVFKRGAETGLTLGIISSKSVQLKKEGTIDTYNTLISPLPGSKPEEGEFAKEGDSGSIISLYRVPKNTAVIVAMIIGGFDLRPTLEEQNLSNSGDNQAAKQNEEKLYLSFSLMEGVNALNKKHELDLKI
ncbi:hypothetical protein CHS0354_011263 [Potamilus streckersoni]|uniref:Uncharacterized protein n=1 Tax=Potamilus streckersoni TaxID=2493646 RepID=A0AAE0VH16_9BIVA|nr:hypothetical protein CHS0354_011263 [Potamilus streckersoni]